MIETPNSAHSVAKIATPQASRYLVQLCKHFAHKLPTTYDENAGQISFSIGECRLAAEGEVLTITVEASEASKLPDLQDVVARHLARFAFREDLKIAWKAA